MINKIATLLILFFFANSCSVSRNNASELKVALESLSEEQLSTLEAFFRVLLTESQGGYVLYGNKPMCVEAFAFREEGSVFLARWIHKFSTELKTGALLWKELGLDKYCKNYSLIISENPVNQWQSLLWINKEELLSSVDKNLVLFQYVLGPKITAESLANQIQDPQNDFTSIIQNDKALIGILLGYGTQNAMCCARVENIQENNRSTPSYGFISTEEEVDWLKTKFSLSTDFSEKKSPLLPWFSCYDIDESKSLLVNYKRTQEKIIKVLKSPNFLEEILSRLFSEKVVLKSYNTSVKPSLPEREELVKAVAQGIWFCLGEKDPEYVSLFVQGVQANERGASSLPEEEFCNLRSRYYANPNEARKEMAYHSGLRVWDHFKKGKDLYSLPEVLDHLSKIELEDSPKSLDARTDQILTNLHYRLYEN